MKKIFGVGVSKGRADLSRFILERLKTEDIVERHEGAYSTDFMQNRSYGKSEVTFLDYDEVNKAAMQEANLENKSIVSSSPLEFGINEAPLRFLTSTRNEVDLSTAEPFHDSVERPSEPSIVSNNDKSESFEFSAASLERFNEEDDDFVSDDRNKQVWETEAPQSLGIVLKEGLPYIPEGEEPFDPNTTIAPKNMDEEHHAELPALNLNISPDANLSDTPESFIVGATSIGSSDLANDLSKGIESSLGRTAMFTVDELFGNSGNDILSEEEYKALMDDTSASDSLNEAAASSGVESLPLGLNHESTQLNIESHSEEDTNDLLEDEESFGHEETSTPSLRLIEESLEEEPNGDSIQPSFNQERSYAEPSSEEELHNILNDDQLKNISLHFSPEPTAEEGALVLRLKTDDSEKEVKEPRAALIDEELDDIKMVIGSNSRVDGAKVSDDLNFGKTFNINDLKLQFKTESEVTVKTGILSSGGNSSSLSKEEVNKIIKVGDTQKKLESAQGASEALKYIV